jgi:hypothetical protein
LASFQGNLTTVAGSGNLPLLTRQADCSLTLIDGSLSVASTSFSVSSLGSTSDYQLVLHNNAFLNTTPNQFTAGCADPITGLPSRVAMYGGLTSQGLLFGAESLGPTNSANPNGVGGGVFSSTPVAAQSMAIYATDQPSAGIVAGDLNKNGTNDIVSVNQGSVTVFLANTNGTLQAGVNYDLPVANVSAASAVIDDVNGDGNLDVVVATDATTSSFTAVYQVWVFLGNGDGTLQNPLSFTTTQSARGVITGDFNGDGKKDLITGTGQVFLGNGNGTFTLLSQAAITAPISNAAAVPESLAAGDFNHNGTLDLAAAYGGVVSIYLGNGNGTFTPGLSYVTNGNSDLMATDLDGDGNLDIYAGLANGGIFSGDFPPFNNLLSGYALMGNGDGTFQGALATPFTLSLEDMYSLYPQYGETGGASQVLQTGSGNIADLNHDGKLDAIAFVLDPATGGFLLNSYLGQGNGTFSTAASQSISPILESGRQVYLTGVDSFAIADFNGDGIPDVVYAPMAPTSESAATAGYFLATGKGDGSFNAPVYIPPPSFYANKLDYNEYIIDLTSADFNHDGKADLLYWVSDADYNPATSGLTNPIQEAMIQLGNGNGTFQAPIPVPLSLGSNPPATPSFATPSAIADVNGDGIPDLLVLQYTGQRYQTQYAGTQLAVYLGNGDGTFQSPTIAQTAANPLLLVLADMNGDGKLDLVASGTSYGTDYSNTTNQVAVSLGNGNGTFQTPVIYSQPIAPNKSYLISSLAAYNLVAADLNGDGNMDVVFGQDVYLGNGNGTLQITSGTQGTQTLTLGSSGSLFAGDFYGHGKPDLLWGNVLMKNQYSLPTAITIQTSPAGLQFSVDGGAAQTAPQVLSLSQGQHTISAATQAGGAGTQYVFSSWSDGGAPTHSVTVGTSAATYTATFTTQYLLTTSATPAGDGTVTASPSSSGYYNAGAGVQLTASPAAGYQFSNWSGGLSGSANPQSITMNAPESVTAHFAAGGATCSFTLTPASTSLPPIGTSTVEVCPNSSGQPSCGVYPETPQSFTVTPNAACGPWTATSSVPEFLQVLSGAGGAGPGTVTFAQLTNTHNGPQSNTITVASGAASATYTVTLAGNADNETYRQIYALYEQFLGRDPDSGGFAFWSGVGGAGLGQMADDFLTSPEAFNTDFAVMAAYQAATGNGPTYAQYAAAAASIRAGAQTVPGLFNSLIGAGFTPATLYQNLLDRAPGTADSSCIATGLTQCFQTIVGYPASTTPVSAPNNEFQSTGIYNKTDHTNALYVQMIYFVTLDRDPDPSGFAFWTGIANNGGPGLLFQGAAGYFYRDQILGPGTPNQGFIGSPEFQGLFAN